MSKKKRSIYKTVVSFIVLSDEPIEDVPLDQIIYETEEGQWVKYNEDMKSKQIKGNKAVKAIYESGSEPGFFFMDDKGNNSEDYEED